MAEAPATHLLELARAEVEVNSRPSRGIREFAEVSAKHAEEGCHRIFRKYGFSAPIKMEHAYLGDADADAPRLRLPWLKFSSWAKYLLDSGRLPRQLCGAATLESMKPILLEFWARFRGLYPRHELFSMEGVDLSMTVPLFSHTDEGRSYKHEPLFVLSTHGCIGRGTRAYVERKKHKVPLKRRGLGLNFIGSTWGTQFMSVAVLRAVLDENPGALDMLMDLYAQDMAKLIHEGIVGEDGTRVFFLHVATKGDLPALAKLGNFKRTHSHVPRQPRSKKPCTGICHLCQAGVEVAGGGSLFPFEDVSDQPSWASTVNATPPWDNIPPVLSGLPLDHGQKASFFKVDFWHNWHLGVAKHWLASSFVCLIERLNKFETGSVDGAFQLLTAEFLQFCKQRKMKPHMAEISRETMSFPTNRTCPVGRWSKGLVATQLMRFLDNFCRQRVVGKTADRVLLTIAAWNLFSMFFPFWSLKLTVPPSV